MKVKGTQLCPALCDPMDCILYSPWNSPGSQNTGGGSCSLLQGIFPTQGSNPGLPHCRWILYQLSHQGSPKGREKRLQPEALRSLCMLSLSTPGGRPEEGLWAHQLLAVSRGQSPPGHSQPQVLREGESQATAGRQEDMLFPQAGGGLSIAVLKLHRSSLGCQAKCLSPVWPIFKFV